MSGASAVAIIIAAIALAFSSFSLGRSTHHCQTSRPIVSGSVGIGAGVGQR